MTAGPFVAAGLIALACAAVAGLFLPRTWLALTLAGAGALLSAALLAPADGSSWEWRGALAIGGETAHLRLDGLSALFLALLAIVGSAGAAYARGYWTDAERPGSAPRARAWWSALCLCIALVLLVSNGLLFLVAWEAFAVASYFLITLERARREVRAAGWLYLAASHAGTLCLFAFFALLAARTGSWDLHPMRDRADLAPLFWLALAGFGLKAGLFPLHVWLPSAHSSAPSHVSALLSGVSIKIGVYGLARFGGWLPAPAAAGWVVAILGAASALLGIAFALGQTDVKRLLAYSSVENVGAIALALGCALIGAAQGDPQWGRLALAGGLLHVLNHGLFKALLFLGAGSVVHATGTREMGLHGGLWRAMPVTATALATGSLAVAALPPLNGLCSEILIYAGLLGALGAGGENALAAAAGIVLLAITGALAIAVFAKACGVVLLGAPRSSAAEHAHESGAWMRGPMLALAALCVALGLAPLLAWPAVASAAAAWTGDAAAQTPAPRVLAALGRLHGALFVAAAAASVWLVRRARPAPGARPPTWDCGYARPTARMQLTAGSFAGAAADWFAWILRPEREVQPVEGPFPRRASHATRTPEVVLERVVEPAGRLVLGAAGIVRRLQHGRLQAYLIYLVAGLVALAALALSGGGR